MHSFFLIVPDFCLILLGTLMATKLKYPFEFWAWTEKLVFYILFPPLLFTSIANAKLTLGTSSEFLLIGLATMMIGLALTWLVKYVIKTDDVTFASVFQCGFRFNTYIGFALVSRVFGEEGFAYLALLVAFWVPVSNTFAVAVLAYAVAKRDAKKTGYSVGRPCAVNRRIITSTLKAIYKNPLIIATVLGLIVNLTGIALPKLGMDILHHLGSASLAMGLLCIGAGLEMSGVKRYFAVIAGVSFVRLIAIACIAAGMTAVFELPPMAAGALIIFAALPTGQSCFVMTANMGGNAGAVANITTAQTLMAMVTLPIVMSLFLM